MSAQSLGPTFKGDVMTENQPAWMKCLSANLFDEATLSCSEYRAFEYRKCDGCPNSELKIQTRELSDPMRSIITSRWITVFDHYPNAAGFKTVPPPSHRELNLPIQ
jgi:hypothetical protein